MIVYILRLHEKGLDVAEEVNELFAGELNPVAAKAQRKVPLPEGYVQDSGIWRMDDPLCPLCGEVEDTSLQ